jgi:TMEM175 potassium channel family protein
MSETAVRGGSETGRLEAFSDGVLAIAITLLVLEIHPPEVEDGLGRALAGLWREYVAYAVTFVLIGIMWANHHGLFRLVRRSDQGLLLANTLLLGGIAFLPFPTGVLATHWEDEAALLLYGGTLTGIALLYNLTWHYARLRGLLVPGLPAAVIRRVSLGYLAGPLAYGAAMLLAPLHPLVSLAVWCGLALLFLLLPYE